MTRATGDSVKSVALYGRRDTNVCFAFRSTIRGRGVIRKCQNVAGGCKNTTPCYIAKVEAIIGKKRILGDVFRRHCLNAHIPPPLSMV